MDDDKEEVSAYFSQLALTIVCHPIEYTKVLIQIGHEPLPARLSWTIFGKRAMLYPNMFQYIAHIKRTDGYFGCFNGLAPALCGNFASACLTMKTVKILQKYVPELEESPNLIVDGEPKRQDYINYCRRDITLHTVSIIISYPFRVITIRMMASFVGREEHYQSMFGAIASIYRENGVLGFFNGIVPKLIGEISCVVASATIAYFVNKHIVKTKEYRSYTLPVLLFLTSTVAYPLLLTSTCMAVCGSSLAAGNPPIMPSYNSWKACLSDLLTRKQHKRGGSLIFRYSPVL